ncbi:MAG: NUDIX hydrolase [Xanthobacteraceae bacterium]
MLSGAPKIEIYPIDRVEIAVEARSWEFAQAKREEIERNFARRQREASAVWNGPVLLLHRYTVRDGLLHGACFETDYASFLAWRDWGFADAAVFNVFACAALQSADGAYLVGEMASSMASAGQIYFPCGTPDPDDVSAAGTLDLAGSVSRELLEETGIDIADLAAEPGWTMVHDRGFMALMKRLKARENAAGLRARIKANLTKQARPEFSDIHIVRGPADLDHRMPRFIVAYLEEAWRR